MAKISIFNHIKRDASGFTIVELMIATTVFSMILLVLAYGILQITDSYYKSITISNTQNVARNVINDLTQSIQFSGGPVLATSTTTGSGSAVTYGYCVGNQLYSYLLGYELKTTFNQSLRQSPHDLIVSNIAGCSSSTTPPDLTNNSSFPSSDQELLSPSMRIAYFNIQQINSILYKVDIRILYGDSDLLNPTTGLGQNATCNGGGAGTQFCAVSELSTVVEKRVQ